MLTIDISVSDTAQIHCTGVLLEKMLLAALYSSLIGTFPSFDTAQKYMLLHL